MPNGVANWPDQCDLRTPEGGACFCIDGYANLYPAPWQFRMVVGDTAAAYLWATGTWLVPFNRQEPLNDACIFELDIFPTRRIQIAKIVNTFYPIGGWTLKYEIRYFPVILVPSIFAYGEIFQEFPLPALTHPPYQVDAWPDEVTVQPRAWDFTL